MFRPKSKRGDGGDVGRTRPPPSHASPHRAAAVEEDYGDGGGDSDGGERKDPEYWRVALPTDDLDVLMWGNAGAPPPASPAGPRFQRPCASDANGKAAVGGGGGGGGGEGEADEQEQDKNDDVLRALEDQKESDAPPPPFPPPPAPDTIILEDVVWKQRSGFGKYSMGIIQHEWEQRRVVLFESGMLRYYAIRHSTGGARIDSKSADEEPRGEIDLMDRGGGERERSEEGGGGQAGSPSHGAKGIRRLSSLGHRDRVPNVGGVKVQARRKQTDPGPTPFEIDVTRRDTGSMWRFCFRSQSAQIEWLSALKTMASGEEDDGDDGDDDDSSDDGKGGDGLADHGFRPGDHVIRWEMLPVLYPIQIHGIVLEAGRNCVIIADFGLASYDSRVAPEGLDTFDDGKDDSHDMIMAAWEKIKPKEKKRLNVIVVTERREVRKWSKINYGDRVEKDKKKETKGGFLSSLLPWEQKGSKKKAEGPKASVVSSDEESSRDAKEICVENGSHDADEVSSAAERNGHDQRRADLVNVLQPELDESNRPEWEPEWFGPGRTPSDDRGGQSVFSVDRAGGRGPPELPKSDSAKLVLARTHFILENEGLLPPYHVFYSNSECIAVWCKTGRWSTLQAAVYLVSSSLGFGKSAAMMTISVAAAHAILVPALAVGGLAVVGAPLLYLKKSQDKWDKTTMRLTEEFWRRARPEVFVEAIEYWGRMGRS